MRMRLMLLGVALIVLSLFCGVFSAPAQASIDTVPMGERWATVIYLPFPDLDGHDPELVAACRWAKSRGILAGYADGTFRPAEAITRREASKLIYRLTWEQPWYWSFDTYPMNQLEFNAHYAPLRWDHPVRWGTMARAEFVRLLYRSRSDAVDYIPDHRTRYGGMTAWTEQIWWRVWYTFRPRFLGGFATSGHVRGSDHYKGRAFDCSSNSATMREIAAYVLRYDQQFKIKYVIHARRISWGGAWYRYYGTNGHYLHVHTSVWR